MPQSKLSAESDHSATQTDPAGRRVSVTVTRATGVGGTTDQSFEYDGLGRQTLAIDDAPAGTARVTIFYDSLGRVLEENQGASDVTHTAFTSYSGTGFTYPGGRVLDVGYDALYRKASLYDATDSAAVANWAYFGNRVATVTLGNGITCSSMNNAQSRAAVQAGQPTPPWGAASGDRLGYDGAGRMIAKRYLQNSSGSGSPMPAALVVGFTTEYDRASNKLYERHLHAESRSHLYPSYDSPSRLLAYQRGTLAAGGGSITTPIALPGTDQQRSYDLDGLGNWQSTGYTPVGGAATTEYRRHNYLNQITRFGTTPVLYDHGNNAASLDPAVRPRGNGNIADDGTRLYQYDAFTRLIEVKRKSDGLPVADYVYDALGRRVRKTVSNGGVTGTVPNGASTFAYDGVQCVEETTPSSTVVQYAWGLYVDELIRMVTSGSAGPQPLAAGSYYPLSDLLYRTVALTNQSGAVVEAYDTDAYGNTLLFSGPGADGVWFTNDDYRASYSACRYVFTGREYDAESSIYYYRRRFYVPSAGRFLQRDFTSYRPRRSRSSPTLDQNVYLFVQNAPIVRLDPSGKESWMLTNGPVWAPQPWPSNAGTSIAAAPSGSTTSSPLCRCGQDVTANLIAMTTSVALAWSALSTGKQLNLEFTTVAPGFNINAWDVRSMPSGTALGGTCGNGSIGLCSGTVTVAGKCYYQKAVNYWLAGIIYSVIHTSPFYPDATLFLEEVYLYTTAKQADDPKDKQDWFLAGTSGLPLAVAAPPALTSCTPCATSAPSNALSWHWGSLTGTA